MSDSSLSDLSSSDLSPPPPSDSSLADLRRILDDTYGPSASPDTFAANLSADFVRRVDQLSPRNLISLLKVFTAQLKGTGSEPQLRNAIGSAIHFRTLTTYTPFEKTQIQQAYSDMYERGKAVAVRKKAGDYEGAKQLVVKHREELARNREAGNTEDDAEFEVHIDDLVETYSQQASTSQKTAENQAGVSQADAGLWIYPEYGFPPPCWFNGLVEFESLPVKRAGPNAAQARDEDVRGHYRTGLCQAIAYTTAANEMCGAWLGAVWIGTRFSRILQVSPTTILLEVGPRKPFNWPEDVWGSPSTPPDEQTTHGVPFSCFRDAGIDGSPANQSIPLAEFLGARTTGPDQLAHDVMTHDGNLDLEELQVWLDLFFTAGLDVATLNVNDPFPTTPPAPTHLEETMQHLSSALAQPFKFPRDYMEAPSRRMEAAYFGSDVEPSQRADESVGSSESFGPAAADEAGDPYLALEASLCKMGIHIVPVNVSGMNASILQRILLHTASVTENDNATSGQTQQWSPQSATSTLVDPSSPSRPSKGDPFETSTLRMTADTS